MARWVMVANDLLFSSQGRGFLFFGAAEGTNEQTLEKRNLLCEKCLAFECYAF